MKDTKTLLNRVASLHARIQIRMYFQEGLARASFDGFPFVRSKLVYLQCILWFECYRWLACNRITMHVGCIAPRDWWRTRKEGCVRNSISTRRPKLRNALNTYMDSGSPGLLWPQPMLGHDHQMRPYAGIGIHKIVLRSTSTMEHIYNNLLGNYCECAGRFTCEPLLSRILKLAHTEESRLSGVYPRLLYLDLNDQHQIQDT